MRRPTVSIQQRDDRGPQDHSIASAGGGRCWALRLIHIDKFYGDCAWRVYGGGVEDGGCGAVGGDNGVRNGGSWILFKYASDLFSRQV